MSFTLSSRSKLLNRISDESSGPVIFWMSRDQRAADNYALFAAQQKAQETKTTLMVVFCLQKSFLGANHKIFNFMISGLVQVEKDLNDLNIPFVILQGNPVEEIPKFVKITDASTLFTDFSPLKIGIKWRKEVNEKINIPFYEVDAHNIVPVWEASIKREFSARTIRPKIHSKLEDYLVEMPKLSSTIINTETVRMIQQAKHDKNIEFSIRGVKGIDWKMIYPVHPRHPELELSLSRACRGEGSHERCMLVGGRLEAEKKLKEFIEKKLPKYSTLKNDPNEDALSELSPYLHFGQISAQRVAIEVLNNLGIKDFGSFWQSPESDPKSKKAHSFVPPFAKNYGVTEQARLTQLHTSAGSFLEELIIRRELAENFCYHTPNYDTFESFPVWAKETLNKHKKDKREFVYTKEQFENADTHDHLWNAAQNQMIQTGKMHGYMRMYWAKKILEWTNTPEDALEIAISLNDKYELDGRDPNGYAGIAWSIGGLHDRPWFERPIFGLVRYMNSSGAEKKFDVGKYIAKYSKI